MTVSADRLGIDHLSVFAMPPVSFVTLAADLGCRFISLATKPIMPFNPNRYPDYSLLDAATRRETRAALADRGVSIAIGEGFGVMPDLDVAVYAADMDALAELGARQINGFSLEFDAGRNADQYGRLAAMGAERGLKVGIEFAPVMGAPTLAATMALIDAIGLDGVGVVVDFMHLGRGGGTVAELAAIDPARVLHVQLCDCTIEPGPMTYAYEAGFDRLAPGDGELPLGDYLAVLPGHCAIGMEIPMRSKIEAGVSIADYLADCVAKAKVVLAG